MFPRRPALLALLVAAILVPPSPVAAAQASSPVTADLDGTAIVLVDVGRYYCHDFDAPRFHCFETAAALDAVLEPASDLLGLLVAAAPNYVVIYENGWYGGASMYVSQDYTVLATIGWNDRISSFKALNSETGNFHWDWFYGGGTPYTFCCNQNVPSLGTWNDNISSVRRT
jgi:hypothetical protein